jgi:hypothetical protein
MQDDTSIRDSSPADSWVIHTEEVAHMGTYKALLAVEAVQSGSSGVVDVQSLPACSGV